MRITFLTRSLNPGGAERQLVALAVGLHGLGHRVMVAPFYGGGPLAEDLCEAGVPVRSLEKEGRWEMLGFLLRLTRLVREEEPDVLHAYLGVPNVLAVLLRPFFPRVRVVWGFRASALDFGRYDRVSRLVLRTERLLSRFADLIIVNSHAGSDQAIKYGFPEKKIAVIPNGIDADTFRPDPEARDRVRAEWGVTEGEKLIGLVGRLIPIKDHPNFLRAAALLLRERGDVRFVCVGDGRPSYRRELHDMARELGLADRVFWAGTRRDIPNVNNALDVATLSSYSEGFPNVVGEAMACGIPCVVTDVGDAAWIVGETGVVVPPRNPEKLAQGWRSVMDKMDKDPALLSHDARRRVVQEFSLGALFEKTSGVLSSCM